MERATELVCFLSLCPDKAPVNPADRGLPDLGKARQTHFPDSVETGGVESAGGRVGGWGGLSGCWESHVLSVARFVISAARGMWEHPGDGFLSVPIGTREG